MTHVIRVLQHEHERQRELLRVMDDMLGDMSSGGDPDFRLLSDIADYLTGYPDQVHHPKEDFIYRRLRKREKRSLDGPGNLVREHDDLSAMTTAFAAAVSEGRRNPASWRQRIEADMRKLVGAYRHHLEMEEKHFFPKALEKLTKKDWLEVTYAITEQVDPLFDEATARFERLRKRIVALASKTAKQVDVFASTGTQIPDLGDVTTIEAFNALGAAVSAGLKLQTHEAGGYELVGDGVSLRIPDCDEQYAAWCACCWLAGSRAGSGDSG